MKRDAAIILGTASQFWLTRVPGPSKYHYLVTKNSSRARRLSPGNLVSGYAIVTTALDR